MTGPARRFARCALAIVGVVVLLAWWTHGFRAFTTDSAALAAAGPLPRPAPSLSFRQPTNEHTSLSAYRGRYVLLTFMYLHCPDVCHRVTARLHQALSQLADGLVPDRLVFLSLSLDPARDSAVSLNEHWRLLEAGPGWIVGGLEEEDGRIQDESLARLGVWVTRLPDGEINHAASSFLIDPDGDVVAVFRPEVSADSLVGALRDLVR
jgi:protein SCO1/2